MCIYIYIYIYIEIGEDSSLNHQLKDSRDSTIYLNQATMPNIWPIGSANNHDLSLGSHAREQMVSLGSQ